MCNNTIYKGGGHIKSRTIIIISIMDVEDLKIEVTAEDIIYKKKHHNQFVMKQKRKKLTGKQANVLVMIRCITALNML